MRSNFRGRGYDPKTFHNLYLNSLPVNLTGETPLVRNIAIDQHRPLLHTSAQSVCILVYFAGATP